MVVVDRDDVTIDRSCVVRIPPGTVIEDTNGNGVIRIAADGITVRFEAGSALVLDGGIERWETLRAVGIVIEGARDVVLVGARVHRAKIGILASFADGLVVDGADVSDGYAMRLGSTPLAEDSGDWLWPHRNDGGEWASSYGGGLVVRDSRDVTVRSCVARRRQNGLLLERVERARVYDNDFSFLSGWGIALWRTSGSVVAHNSADMCVRGYSHGVYNRGQDSAGLLMFEQCNDNVVAFNSFTHGGDGIFGFAGRDALGEDEAGQDVARRRLGCNRNVFVGNDLSFAAAHGLEMTFSFDNTVMDNLFRENAICGIWGGFSQDMVIARNTFVANGAMAYGRERGGINIEHGSGVTIARNTFERNAVGVHLWHDDPGGLARTPWYRANHRGLSGNRIVQNSFTGDAIGVELRDDGPARDDGSANVVGTVLAGNTMDGVERPEAVGATIEVLRSDGGGWSVPGAWRSSLPGTTRPVGARAGLAGRQAIVMGEYFPWDHASAMVQRADGGEGEGLHRYLVRSTRAIEHVELVDSPGADICPGVFEPADAGAVGVTELTVSALEPGVLTPYAVGLRVDGQMIEARGVVADVRWDCRFFRWTPDAGSTVPSPPGDLAAWRALADGPGAVAVELARLRLAYGAGGPGDVAASAIGDDAKALLGAAGLGRDYFGMVARATITLPPGSWEVRTLSDDGVRVRVRDAGSADEPKTVLENWTHHGPTRDEAGLIVDASDHPAGRKVEVTVEHFEIMGHAVLEFAIEPAAAGDRPTP